MTSHDVVQRIRRIFDQKRVGHTGTLDPMVEGVLPILLGRATRLSDFFMNSPKVYRGVGVLGAATDTEDAEGSIIERADAGHVTESALREALLGFVGEQLQMPPDYSAVKIGGRKLMDYARAGREIPQKRAKKINIYSAELLGFNLPEYEFRIKCSKGTYVRTICADLGRKLGTLGHMKKLVRESSGGFLLEEAVPLSKVDESAVMPLTESARHLSHMSRIELPSSEALERELRHGIKRNLREVKGAKIREVDGSQGGFLVFVGDEFFGLADEDGVFSKLIIDED